MPQAIAFVVAGIEAAAAYIGAAVGNALIAVGASAATASAVATAVYNIAFYGAELGIMVGVGKLLTPSMPKPQAGAQAIRSPIQSRLSGIGQARLTRLSQALYEAKDGAAYDVYADHDGPITATLAWWLNDDDVTLDGSGFATIPMASPAYDGKKYLDGSGSPLIKVLHREGAPTETVYSELTTALGSGVWAATARGDGVGSIAQISQPVKSKYFLGAFPQGVPLPTRAAQLLPLFDPRAGGQVQGTRSTYAWSDNPVLGLLGYLTDANGGMGLDYSRFIAPEAGSSWTDAANDCDSAVAVKAGGTEKRYRCWQTWMHDTPPKDVIKTILASFDGWLGQRGDGVLVVRSGRYYAPTVSIAAQNITGYSLQRLVATDDAINSIDPTFVSALNKYAEEPVTRYENAADIAARGRRNVQPLGLPQSPSPGQSSRLAKRAIGRSLAPRRGWIMTDLSGFNALGERYINIALVEAGTTLYSGPVEVVDAQMILGQGVRFDWVQADPAIDDWDPATEEGDAPADIPAVVSTALTAPTISAVTIFAQAASDGSQGARLEVTAAGPNRADLTWFLQWKVTGAGAWNETTFSDIPAGASVTIDSGFVTVDASVDVQVAYQTGSGAFSGWSSTSTISTASASIAPASPAITAHAGGVGTYSIGWTNPNSSNFAGARVWKAPHGTAFGSATDASGLRTGAVSSTDTYAPTGISAGTYDLWVTAENGSGAKSAPAGPVTVTVT